LGLATHSDSERNKGTQPTYDNFDDDDGNKRYEGITIRRNKRDLPTRYDFDNQQQCQDAQ
jgi:hypothetical protein